MIDTDIEGRLTEVLDTTAGALADSAPPTFSWHAAPRHAPWRRILSRGVKLAGSGLIAAAVAAAVVITVNTATGAYLGSQSVSPGYSSLDAVTTGVANHIGTAGN